MGRAGVRVKRALEGSKGLGGAPCWHGSMGAGAEKRRQRYSDNGGQSH